VTLYERPAGNSTVWNTRPTTTAHSSTVFRSRWSINVDQALDDRATFIEWTRPAAVADAANLISERLVPATEMGMVQDRNGLLPGCFRRSRPVDRFDFAKIPIGIHVRPTRSSRRRQLRAARPAAPSIPPMTA
jgi:hypothetical protein